MSKRTIFGAHVAVDAPNSPDDQASGRLAHVLGPTTDGARPLVPVSSCRNYSEAIETAQRFEANRLARIATVKAFDLIDEATDERVMRSLSESNVYVTAYGSLLAGELAVSDLDVGQRTRKRYALSGGKPTVYAIERVS